MLFIMTLRSLHMLQTKRRIFPIHGLCPLMNIRYKKYIGMQEKNRQAIPMCATQHVIQVLNNSVCTVT